MPDRLCISLDQLTAETRANLAAFQEQLLFFNRRINLVSRESEAHFEERHLLHSLALTLKAFPAGTTVVDWGSGGGLPVIPLAICFPDVTFYAIDAVGKKVQCLKTIARRLGLTNLHPWHGRAERWQGTAQYSTSRATAPLLDLWKWHIRVVEDGGFTPSKNSWESGLICLKGGGLREEIAALYDVFPGVDVVSHSLQPLLGSAFFSDKYILEVAERKK